MFCLPTTFHSAANNAATDFDKAFTFAEQLRQSKKSKILLQKRHKLYAINQETLDVTPEDFLHIYNHDMHWHGTL